MATLITCPTCSAQFEPSGAFAQSIEKEMRMKLEVEWNKRKEALAAERQLLDKRAQDLQQLQEQQEAELRKRVDAACAEREVVIAQNLRQQIQDQFQTKLAIMSEQQQEREHQLKSARQHEFELNRQIMELKDRTERMALDNQRQLMEARKKMEEELRRQEEERYKLREQEHQFKLRELEMQLSEQKRLAEEALRKAEQGSMQLQGEVQEVILEDLLRQAFPFDAVNPIGKGARGADCLLTVRNQFAQDCGSIVFESKRTQNFTTDWIEKLKNDMISCGADLAVIVTRAMPKEVTGFGELKGVYICGFSDVKAIVAMLRQALIKIYEARKSQENKGEKMVMLYDYLTGAEFMTSWKAMRDSFQNFRGLLQKERDDFERNWKKKEKMLEQIINNSLQISGSIEGISGTDSLGWSHGGNLPGDGQFLVE